MLRGNMAKAKEQGENDTQGARLAYMDGCMFDMKKLRNVARCRYLE